MRRLDTLTHKLFDNPLFPLLFIAEATKLSALSLIGASTPEAAVTMAVLAIPTTALWYYFGDDIEESVDSFVGSNEE